MFYSHYRNSFGTRLGEADVVALIHKPRRKPRGGDRLSFAAIAERLHAEGRRGRCDRM
jgi:hypothetical protein